MKSVAEGRPLGGSTIDVHQLVDHFMTRVQKFASGGVDVTIDNPLSLSATQLELDDPSLQALRKAGILRALGQSHVVEYALVEKIMKNRAGAHGEIEAALDEAHPPAEPLHPPPKRVRRLLRSSGPGQSSADSRGGATGEASSAEPSDVFDAPPLPAKVLTPKPAPPPKLSAAPEPSAAPPEPALTGAPAATGATAAALLNTFRIKVGSWPANSPPQITVTYEQNECTAAELKALSEAFELGGEGPMFSVPAKVAWACVSFSSDAEEALLERLRAALPPPSTEQSNTETASMHAPAAIKKCLPACGEQRCKVELVGSLLNPASSMQRWLRTSWEEVEDSLAEGELQRLEGSVLSEIATAEGEGVTQEAKLAWLDFCLDAHTFHAVRADYPLPSPLCAVIAHLPEAVWSVLSSMPEEEVVWLDLPDAGSKGQTAAELWRKEGLMTKYLMTLRSAFNQAHDICGASGSLELMDRWAGVDLSSAVPSRAL